MIQILERDGRQYIRVNRDIYSYDVLVPSGHEAATNHHSATVRDLANIIVNLVHQRDTLLKACKWLHDTASLVTYHCQSHGLDDALIFAAHVAIAQVEGEEYDRWPKESK